MSVLLMVFLTGYKIHDNYAIIPPEDQQSDMEAGQIQERNNTNRRESPSVPPSPNSPIAVGRGKLFNSFLNSFQA